jgi:caffeoyl-CoA O-methyltransferase
MTTYDEKLSQYISGLFAAQDAGLLRAWEDTPRKGLPAISVQPEEGRFLQFLVRASGARRALEIGTLGGYSGIWIARGLAPGGRLITLEKEPYHARVAQEHFDAAGVGDRVEIRVGEALALLQALAAEQPFDFVFIDADKTGYPAYFAWALEHTRLGGVIAAHNAFRGGAVVRESDPDESTRVMRDFNRSAAANPRLISTLYPAGDGTLLAVKIA